MNITPHTSPARATEVATESSTATSPTTSDAERASLVPEPASSGLDGIQDAMSMMYALISKQGNLTLASGEAGVNATTRAQQAEEAQQEAQLKQEEAAEAKAADSGGLFGEIGHLFEDVGKDFVEGNLIGTAIDTSEDAINIVDNPHFPEQLAAAAPTIAEYVGIAAAIIGAAAITVASGGVGGVVIAAVVIALSASGTLVTKTGCLGKDSAYIGLGLDIAATVVSCGASSGTMASGALDTASAVASAASGAADVGAGISTVVTGNQSADIQDDIADVQQTTAALNRNARLLEDLVAGLKDAQQSNKTALQVLAGASQTYGQTLTLAASAAKA